ncbi:MAG: hypothetical protein M3Y48_09800 [Actinomycetota bacterium]|nr:hypothetical protein [Actinomycetota bacterium]
MNSTARTFPPTKKVRAVEFTTCTIAGQVVPEGPVSAGAELFELRRDVVIKTERRPHTAVTTSTLPERMGSAEVASARTTRSGRWTAARLSVAAEMSSPSTVPGSSAATVAGPTARSRIRRWFVSGSNVRIARAAARARVIPP